MGVVGRCWMPSDQTGHATSSSHRKHGMSNVKPRTWDRHSRAMHLRRMTWRGEPPAGWLLGVRQMCWESRSSRLLGCRWVVRVEDASIDTSVEGQGPSSVHKQTYCHRRAHHRHALGAGPSTAQAASRLLTRTGGTMGLPSCTKWSLPRPSRAPGLAHRFGMSG